MNIKCNDISVNRFFRVGEYIAKGYNQLSSIKKKDLVFYYDGTYYGHKKNLEKLFKKFDVNIIEIKSSRMGIYKFIPIPAPLLYLIKIESVDELPQIIRELDDMGVFSLYIFNKDKESEFIKNFSFFSKKEPIKYIAKVDKCYLFYMVDTNNVESETGFLECYSVGKKIPRQLKWFF